MMCALSDRMIQAGLVAAAAVALGLATAAPVHAQETSQVFVVHGIPGQPVDVYVDGEAVLSDFEPGDVAGPLELAAGSYDVVITAPGDPVTSPIISAEGAEIPGGANLSLVAHLSEEGEPTLTPFVNDVTAVAAGEARITVRHTAAAPAVDVRVGGEPTFTGLTNPEEATADVPAGTITADVVLAGTEDVAIGPADLTLAEGTLTIVYAIGSADDGTLDLVVQVIEGLEGAPTGVPAGTGGLAATGLTAGWLVLAGCGALLLVGGLFRVAAARRAWSA
jgi:hypothetical protein